MIEKLQDQYKAQMQRPANPSGLGNLIHEISSTLSSVLDTITNLSGTLDPLLRTEPSASSKIEEEMSPSSSISADLIRILRQLKEANAQLSNLNIRIDL